MFPSRFTPAAFALLLLSAVSAPAHAADKSCKNPAGVDIPGDTNQGYEVGIENTTCATTANATGVQNNASAEGATAIGYQNEAFAINSVAMGRGNITRGLSSLAIGFNNETAESANYATAIGRFNTVAAERGVALGINNNVVGQRGLAMGTDSLVSGTDAVALGFHVTASHDHAVAIGDYATTDRAYSVSFGDALVQRQLTHVAAGTQATDATNLSQLRDMAGTLGGGAGFDAGGAFVPPVYTIQGNNYGTVWDALAAVDGRLTSGGGSGAGVSQTYVDNADARTLLAANQHSDSQAQQVVASARKYAQMAENHADRGDAATLTAAKAYTDQQVLLKDDRFTQLNTRVERGFQSAGQRIDKTGAMSVAMTQMSVNTMNGSSTKGRLAVGIGVQGNQAAVAVGYGKRFATRASFSLGASFTQGHASAGAGIGLDL